MKTPARLILLALLLAAGCDGTTGDLFVERGAVGGTDAGAIEDSGPRPDAGAADTGLPDAGEEPDSDAGADGGADAGADAGDDGGTAADGGAVTQECITRTDQDPGACRPMDAWIADASQACEQLKLNLDHRSAQPVDPRSCPPHEADGITYRCCTLPPGDGCVERSISDPDSCRQVWELRKAAIEACLKELLLMTGDFVASGDCVAGTDPSGNDIPGFKVAKFTCCPPQGGGP